MAKKIETIFHASFTCVTHNNRHDQKSRLEYFHSEMNKNDFWEWVKMYLEEFDREYKSVTVDSISMI